MKDLIKTVKKEINVLHYPTKDRIIKSTAITLCTAIISSLIITVDTNTVTKLVELIVTHM